MSNPELLKENPKGENESWESWGERLAQKYPTPAATPNLPLVPGHDKLPETWEEYGTQWKVHYNTHIAGKPIPTSGPTLPPLPTTDATGEDWATWGSAVSEAWNEYAKEKGVDLPKVLEGLKKPELINGDWASYSAEWDEYGKQVGEKFQAALAAKST
ncbi:hypothetical protein BJ322DRAFT_1181106 [Thelephora terrestris]|uniref:Uncharacterized protein n=1 Tax=Thelephora terrestris TaxID=56493 RepID=A0A9P6L9I2_9AGAM|nr:hypothetical protein BJ322DRAFT_1181106 [Thelephora terrestris]